MSPYAVTFARSARRELEALDRPLVARVFKRIEALTGNPRPAGCRKLVGQVNLWRIRIGDYRLIYEVDDGKRVVDVVAVRHRSDAYR
jgi:mRNA interferase RelE/StbE